jgi:hypothetical protein
MKKTAWGAALLAAAIAPGSAHAEGWNLFPFLDEGWSPDFTLAATGGLMTPDIDGVDTDTAVGAQLSLTCPWFAPPSGEIRQQFNYTRYDEGNLEIRSLELNPHYYIGEGNLTFGFGPGVGYVWVEPDGGKETTLWAAQFSADVEYRRGMLFVGAGTRYQLTEDLHLGGSERGANNWLHQVKVGVNF